MIIDATLSNLDEADEMTTSQTQGQLVDASIATHEGQKTVATIVRRLKIALRALIGKKAYDKVGHISLRRSETSRHRALLEKFCIGYGIDIGFGGDPITPKALRMDLPSPYTAVGSAPVQLGGDCRNLRWLRDGVLDYVYSSHVLEDFPESETFPILQEW